MFIQQRATPRQPVVHLVPAVVFHGERQLAGRIADISEGGARFVLEGDEPLRLPETLAIGAHVTLVVKSDNEALECEVRNIGDAELGLSFFDRVCRVRRRELIARITN